MDIQCERCGNKASILISSVFNTDMICEECVCLEMRHSQYKEARETLIEHIKNGVFNFPGVGLPLDLRCKKRRIEECQT